MKRSLTSIIDSNIYNSIEYATFKWRTNKERRSPADCLDNSPLLDMNIWPHRIIAGEMKLSITTNNDGKRSPTKPYYSPYYIFRDVDALVTFVMDRLPNGTLNVMVEGDRPVSVYFDIDRKGEQRKFCSLDLLLDSFQRTWIRFLQSRISNEFATLVKGNEDPRTVVSNHSADKDKDSFHRHSIGLAAYSIGDLNVYMKAFKEYIQQQHEKLNCSDYPVDVQWDDIKSDTNEREEVQDIIALYHNDSHVIDFSVYNRGRMFRLPFNCKPGGAPLLPYPSIEGPTDEKNVKQWITYALPHQLPVGICMLPENHSVDVDTSAPLHISSSLSSKIKRRRELNKIDDDSTNVSHPPLLTHLSTEQSTLALTLLSNILSSSLPKTHPLSIMSLDGARIHGDGKGGYSIAIDDSKQVCPHSGLQHKGDDFGKSSIWIPRIDPLKGNTVLRVVTNCYRSSCKEAHVNGSSSSSVDWSLLFRPKLKYTVLKVWTMNDNNNMKMKKKKKKGNIIDNQTHLKAICELHQLLFSSDLPIHVDPVRDSLAQFKANGYFGGMKYEGYEARYCPKIIMDEKCTTVVIKSECGTGKTTAVVDLVKQICGTHKSSDKRILSLTARQSLARTQQAAFNAAKLNVKCYLDETPQTMSRCSNLIISPDSCIHLADHGLYAPYLLILDEFGPLLKYIAHSSTLTKKRKVVHDTVMQVIRIAKYVVVLDADLSDHELEVLATLRESTTTTVYHNKQKTNTKEYLVLPSHNAGIRRLITLLKEGKRIYVPCDGKKVAQDIYAYIQKELPDKKVIHYDGKSSPLHKQSITACNTEWLNYDVVITSPTIIYGVDFNPVHFHQVIAFFKGHTIDAVSAFQSMERPRSLIDKYVTVCIDQLRVPSSSPSLSNIEYTLLHCENEWDHSVASLDNQYHRWDRSASGIDYGNNDYGNDDNDYNDSIGLISSDHVHIHDDIIVPSKKANEMNKTKMAMSTTKMEQQSMLPTIYVPDKHGKYHRRIDTTTNCNDPFALMLRNTTHSRLESRAAFLQLLTARICTSGGILRFASLMDVLLVGDGNSGGVFNPQDKKDNKKDDEKKTKKGGKKRSRSNVSNTLVSDAKLAERAGDDKRLKDATSIVAAPLISKEVYEKLKVSKTLDDHGQAKIDKYLITQCYGREPKADDPLFGPQFIVHKGEDVEMNKFRNFAKFARIRDDFIHESKDSLSTGEKHKSDVANQLAQFDALEYLMDAIGVKIGHDFEINSKKEAPLNGTIIKQLCEKEQHYLTLFPLVGRQRKKKEKESTRFAYMDLLIRLLHSVFPSPLINRKSRRLGSGGKDGTEYSYMWTLTSHLDLLKSRLEWHTLDYTLKEWATSATYRPPTCEE
jgi:hypothetical protein